MLRARELLMIDYFGYFPDFSKFIKATVKSSYDLVTKNLNVCEILLVLSVLLHLQGNPRSWLVCIHREPCGRVITFSFCRPRLQIALLPTFDVLNYPAPS